MDAVLSIRDLSVDFLTPRGPVHALRRVSVDVPRGSIVGIVGESGSGKSTLSLATIGLLAPNAVVRGGQVLFDGTDLLTMNPARLRDLRGRRMSMVFQDPDGRYPVSRPWRQGGEATQGGRAAATRRHPRSGAAA
jgi:ABC-type glutathione transport system ATPase component